MVNPDNHMNYSRFSPGYGCIARHCIARHCRAQSRPTPLLFTLLLLFAACSRHEFAGTVFEEAQPAAPIHGENYNGAPFDLADLEGDAVLLFFGYTFCPDVCPLTLMELAATKRALEEDAPGLAADLQVVFVSIDPKRDNLARLKPYVQAFHPQFYGVRVSAQKLETLKPAYGLYASPQEGQNASAEFYLLDHTSGIYLIDRDGNWQGLFRADVTAEELTADLKELLR